MEDWFDPVRGLFDVDYIQDTVRLLVVGGGRVGRAFILMAASHGLRRIRLIEPDWVSRRNYASGFGEAGMGLEKAAFVEEELFRQSPRIFFEASTAHLTTEDTKGFEEWLSLSTHVALFIDSFGVASRLASLAYAERPCVYAAVLENGRTGEAAWSVPRRTPCLNCTARLTEKHGAQGGQTAFVDVMSTVSVVFRQFMGLCLAGRYGFDAFRPFVDPRSCLALVVNRPGGFVETGKPDVPAGVRLVQVVDGHGHGPSCPTCRGYQP
jgi:hypothetical protein